MTSWGQHTCPLVQLVLVDEFVPNRKSQQSEIQPEAISRCSLIFQPLNLLTVGVAITDIRCLTSGRVFDFQSSDTWEMPGGLSVGKQGAGRELAFEIYINAVRILPGVSFALCEPRTIGASRKNSINGFERS